MSSVEKIAEFHIATESVVVATNSTLSAMFLPGFYILLFGMSIKILCKRHHERPQRMLYLGWTVTLFVLASVTNAFQGWMMIQQQIIYFEAGRTRDYSKLIEYLFGETLKTVPNTFVNIGANVINFVANTMLVRLQQMVYHYFKSTHILWGDRLISKY
ncbi:hypothetical protein Moror_9230 [Moniliophthora roreri MCA 2997]|uniref:Uncharacterized protein n=1 Tax=Moniliophthora roreri (strain MCA 2997) TaxID=1381753 RepID=V2WDP1_MONRO|nr:hypothetical protein Moror_9230 [Moniliophthora roreri MCA 2997]